MGDKVSVFQASSSRAWQCEKCRCLWQFAFMCLPASCFFDGEISYNNIGLGRLFPVGPTVGLWLMRATSHLLNIQLDPATPREEMVQGLVIFSPRARSIAAWLQSLELCYMRVGRTLFKYRDVHLQSDLGPGQFQ
jgi:hypothetical protein